MTTFNTGNPVPSTDVRDLFDNAQNFDEALNNRTSQTWLDRLGVPRASWFGLEQSFDGFMSAADQAFQQFLVSSGYQDIGVYAAGLEITARNQIFLKDGEYYRAAASLQLPYTTTGIWAEESDFFVSVGDAALRQELAAASGDGSDLVSFKLDYLGAVSRSLLDRGRDWVNVHDFGAIGDGTYHPLSEKFASLPLAQVAYPFVTSLSQSVDWAATQAALYTGRSVCAKRARYVITNMLFPTARGQVLWGAGIDQTVFVNSVNDEPLWAYGDVFKEDGAAEFSGIGGLNLEGNETGATLWGLYAPTTSSRTVDGCGNASNNYYASRNHANWTLAARGCFLDEIRVRNVKGGISLHLSAWAFRGTRPHLVGNLRGVRQMGDCNGNVLDQAYISSCTEYSILHPNMTDGGVKNAHYRDCIVQQSGWDGNGSVSLLFGEATRISNMYTERNDEKGGNVDIFIGASESNCVVDGVTHKLEVDTGNTQVIIRCASHNATIRNVDWRNTILYALDLTATNLAFAVRYENIRPRNNTAGLATQDVHIANTAIGHITLDTATGALQIGPHRVGRGDAATAASDKFALRQGRSTSAFAQVESLGGMRFITDAANVISGGNFEFRHNGEDSAGELLLQLRASDGALHPGTNGTQSNGLPAFPWSVVHAASGTIQPSDERLKKIRGSLTEAEIRAWERVQPVIYQFLDAIDRKGDDARLHTGYRAQDVEECFIAEGLDPTRYALFCKDEITKTAVQKQMTMVPQYRVTTQTTERIDVIDGVPVQTFEEEIVRTPIFDYLPLHDTAGNPVLDDLGNPRLHQVPVMALEEVEVSVVQSTDTRLGLRYDECLCWRDAYGRHVAQKQAEMINRLAGEVEALKKRLP